MRREIKKNSLLKKIVLYYYTVKKLKINQITFRLINGVKKNLHTIFPKAFKRIYFSNYKESSFYEHIETKKPGYWQANVYNLERNKERLLAIEKNVFSFLNVQKNFKDKIQWQNKELTYLWDFHLHYFDYLVPLYEKEVSGNIKKGTCNRIILSWIEKNGPFSYPGWHPYVVSLRIINWIKYLLLSEKRSEIIIESLFLQISFLENNMERHLLCNHYLENARALLFGGYVFNGKKPLRWKKKGKEILELELCKQIKPSGSHFENSPMYHSNILAGLLDTQILVSAFKEKYAWLDKRISKMKRWLQFIECPDGSFPLFNDSEKSTALQPVDLFSSNKAYSNSEEKNRSVESSIKDDIAVIRQGQWCCIVTNGTLGPEYNQGHGHAGNLSYELFLHKNKVITDTGIYNYESNNIRDYSRKTISHNTIVINNRNQSEVWGAFRTARAVKEPVSSISNDKDKKIILYSGSHDGYVKQRLGWYHKRYIISVKDFGMVFVDRIHADKAVKAVSYIHIDPLWNSTLMKNKNIECSVGKKKCLIKIFEKERGNVDIVEKKAFVFPEFGIKKQTKKYILNKSIKENEYQFICYGIFDISENKMYDSSSIKIEKTNKSNNGKHTLHIYQDKEEIISTICLN